MTEVTAGLALRGEHHLVPPPAQGLADDDLRGRRQHRSHHRPLRYYEREGLLADPVSRDSAGRRVYTDSDLAWLRLCVVLRATGLPLAVLRRYTELAREGDGTESARLELLRTHGHVVRARIAEWERSSRT